MPPRIVATPFFRPSSEDLRFLPEGPQQLRDGRVGWVAIQHGRESTRGSLNVLDLRTRENRSHTLPGRPGFFVETDEAGVWIVGMERKLVLFDWNAGAIREVLAELPEDPRVIINDGIGTPVGLIFGTKDLEFKQPIAKLYHYSGRLRELYDRQVCSNGKYFRGDRLIDIDSQPRTITEYRYSAERPLEMIRRIAPPERLPSVPDGMRSTADGESIVVAYYNPEAVADGVAQQIRIADGVVEREWVFPGSPRVTCPEFVTIDGRRQLLFTTAAEGMPPEIAAIAPEAGTMFLAEAD